MTTQTLAEVAPAFLEMAQRVWQLFESAPGSVRLGQGGEVLTWPA